MKYNLTFLLYISFLLFSCNNNIIHTEKSIISLQDSIKTYQKTKLDYRKTINLKTSKINELNENQPDKYGQLKSKSDMIRENIKDLNLFINTLKKESTENPPNENNFDALSDVTIYDKILTENKGLSKKAIELKEKIDVLYRSNKEILSSNRILDTYNENKFNTNRLIIDKNGKEIDYMKLNLMDKSVIGVLYYLEGLQLELETFHFLFMNSIVQ
jgi:hypothetical protein